MSNKIDISQRVPNTERRFGQAPDYYPADVVMGGRRYPALFTWTQLVEAIRRAEANREDIPKPGHWERIKRWFRG